MFMQRDNRGWLKQANEAFITKITTQVHTAKTTCLLPSITSLNHLQGHFTKLYLAFLPG